MTATMQDVAQHAGVSIKTVSRFFSGRSGVSPKTAAKIQAAAEALDFVPSAAARALRGQSVNTIALITENLTTTPFAHPIVSGVQSVCEASGRLLFIGEAGDSEPAFLRLMERFRRQNVEAIIRATFFHRTVAVSQQSENFPLVLVNCFDEEGCFNAVVPDDEQGTFDLTRHLIDLGHRDIAYITLPEDLIATGLRLRGFRRAMKDAGLAVRSEWIARAVHIPPKEDSIWIEHLLRRWMSASPRPSALMCGNDTMALRVLTRLYTMGLTVPEDVSVVGFDDFTMISENTVPDLTTAALPHYHMGVRATELAMRLRKDDSVSPEVERCRCELVPRGSTRRIRHTTQHP